MTPEPQQIRTLQADGWRYHCAAIEPHGLRLQPVLYWRRAGVEQPMYGPLYTTERAAWAWCDQWARRATQ